MGSYIEINDTLQLTEEQGFPVDTFSLEAHRKNPVTLKDVEGKIFHFKNKPSARIFQLDPVRVFYVHNIEGKWLFWGHVFMQSQTIEKKFNPDGTWTDGQWVTSGTYIIEKVYDPKFQEVFTRQEAPHDRNFFIP